MASVEPLVIKYEPPGNKEDGDIVEPLDTGGGLAYQPQTQGSHCCLSGVSSPPSSTPPCFGPPSTLPGIVAYSTDLAANSGRPEGPSRNAGPL